MMKNCVYCTLPVIQERKIIENDLAWAFPTNMPITPGHILIVPKRCITKYEDATNDEKKAGQSVPHFHLHIIPRKEGDAGIYEYEPRKFLYRPGERKESPEAELQEVSELIKKNI